MVDKIIIILPFILFCLYFLKLYANSFVFIRFCLKLYTNSFVFKSNKKH